jgi:phosphopantetheine adenylyltransferase
LRSISGSRVREISKLGGKYQGFVSAGVAAQIVAKLKA